MDLERTDPFYVTLDAGELFQRCAERRAGMQQMMEECGDADARAWIADVIRRTDLEEGAEIARLQTWVEHEGGSPDLDHLMALSVAMSAAYEDVISLADEDA